MRLQVKKVSDGPGPGEVVITVKTSSGSIEQVVVHYTAIEHDTIDVGYPIHRSEGQTLVELPRESMSGKWRLWVPQSAMVE